ncbi:MAG: hypothetical protein J6252_01055, partial [Clostridia bacterium]|nr:hypothetical protein [Clostridia bacterium]
MKRFKIKTGGLQKKTALLVLIVLLATSVIFSIATNRQNRKLEAIVSDTRSEQQQAISQTSKLTMHRVLSDTLLRTTVLQANIANNDFSEVIKNVLVLKTIAESLFHDRDRLEFKEVFPPDPQNDGFASAMVLCEEGIEYTESEYLRIAAHLSDIMIAFYNNSEKIEGLYIGLADGTDLCVDTKPSLKLDENG